ncbi:MAG: HAMP domain-containing sensor histidine kinase, partial [Cyanobacteria bacterium P01_F01_bin.42]
VDAVDPKIADSEVSADSDNVIPLSEDDLLRLDQFCVVLTREFSWAATLSHPPQSTRPFFDVSFNPATVEVILALLGHCVQQQRPEKLAQYRDWLSAFPVVQPSYSWPMQFSRKVLAQSAKFDGPSVVVKLSQPDDNQDSPPLHQVEKQRLPDDEPLPEISSPVDPTDLTQSQARHHDIELLKAIAHEIRTPLATIQTLTRLLIRRSDLSQDVINRLESIQQECTNQIDRFSLIFRAIELTTTPSASLQQSLTTISLQQLFRQKMARWESILERRSLELDVNLPEDLPAIAIRDPNMLDQVLTGLIEQLSHTLPLGSQISLRVTLAGDQLKLQLRSALPNDDAIRQSGKSMLKAVGQLLMLQPETGNLSLSLPATKEIFNFLGGKLTVRQTPPRGEVLTMFLPLDPLGRPVA